MVMIICLIIMLICTVANIVSFVWSEKEMKRNEKEAEEIR